MDSAPCITWSKSFPNLKPWRFLCGFVCFCFFGGFLNLLKAWCLCLSHRNLDFSPPRIDSCIWCRETPVLWPPHAKSWLTGKDSDAGRDWGQEEKGTTEDEMAGWHQWLDGRESEWTPGDGDGQGGLACCDSRGHKESDTTERLNWTELNWMFNIIILLGFLILHHHLPDCPFPAVLQCCFRHQFKVCMCPGLFMGQLFSSTGLTNPMPMALCFSSWSFIANLDI